MASKLDIGVGGSFDNFPVEKKVLKKVLRIKSSIFFDNSISIDTHTFFPISLFASTSIHFKLNSHTALECVTHSYTHTLTMEREPFKLFTVASVGRKFIGKTVCLLPLRTQSSATVSNRNSSRTGSIDLVLIY